MILLAEEVAYRMPRDALIQFVARLEAVVWTTNSEEVWKFEHNICVFVQSHDIRLKVGNFYRLFAQSDEISDTLRAKIPPIELPVDFDEMVYKTCVRNQKNFISLFTR